VRPPDSRYPEGPCLDTMADPYLVAGYLRYWHFAYQKAQRDPRARFQDPQGLPWSPIAPPEFAFGVRFGAKQRADTPCRTMERHCTASGLLTGGWGARNIAGGYYGDEWFDRDPENGRHLMPRPAGTLGLLLLQVIDRAAGDAPPDLWDRPTFGVVVPDGGPAIFGVVT